MENNMDKIIFKLNMKNKDYKEDTKYMRIWFSDNPPHNKNNPGYIGITIYDKHMIEIDGGKLDYNDENVDLRDMVKDCIDFMELEVESYEETVTLKFF